MSAHPASHRRGWLSAVVAQVCDYVFEEAEETVEQPGDLVAQPVIAVVAAARRSGASTVARLLAAELGARTGGAAVVSTGASPRRVAPPSRAAAGLATALAGAGDPIPIGRLCIVERDPDLVNAARYLAPVVLDLRADGSAAGVAAIADRVLVVSSAAGEPALLDAVASIVGGDALKVVTRVSEHGDWPNRADALLPESRIAGRAAALGARAVGSLGAGIARLADAIEVAP